MIIQNRAAQELAAARERYNNPVPAPDYDQIQIPEISRASPPVGADEIGQKAFAAADALHEEAVYLDAFAANYDRYLGAKRNRDAQAMLRLAAIMVRLAEQAAAAGQSAAQRQSEFEAQVQQKLNEMRASLEASGIGWSAALKRASSAVKTRGFPQEVKQELAEAKVPAEEIAALQQQLEATTPEAIDADIAALKSPSATDPPYLSDFQNAEQLATNSWNETQAAIKASTPDTGRTPTTPTAAGTKTSPALGHSTFLCSLFGALGALVVVAFIMGVRSAKGRSASPGAT